MNVDKLREVDWPVCIVCHNRYHPIRTKGTLPCRIHPLPKNSLCRGKRFPLFHYECCGAVDRIEDFKHYEKTKPYGCLAIDHVTSLDDLRNYFSVPYFILKKSSSSGLQVLNANSPHRKENVIEIHSSNQLDNPVIFPVYNSRSLHLKLRDIYTQISNIPDMAISGERVYYKTKDSRKYYTDGTASSGAKITESAFEAFYIIRRCASEQDPEKLEEVGYGEGPCVISYKGF